MSGIQAGRDDRGHPGAIAIRIVYIRGATHKVLITDGRILEKDPVTGKWDRTPLGIDKELWNKRPPMRETLRSL